MTKKKCELCSVLPDEYTYDDCDHPADKEVANIISKLITENGTYKKCPACGSYYSFEQKYDSLMFGREPIITTIKRVNTKI